MAKKKKDKEEALEDINTGSEPSEKGGNRIVTIIIAFVIIIIWLGVFALLIKLDVGGFGSGVLRPILKDIPIINRILPSGTDGEYIENNETTYKNLSEAVKKIKELELKLDSLTDINSVNGDYVKELEAEVSRLKIFEENQKTFEERVKEFETNVVFGKEAPSIEEYKKYYEAFDPQHAADLYQQVTEQLRDSQNIIDSANLYSKMDPKKAASALELMTSGDLDVVCGILKNMKEAQAAAIMAEMDATTVALITKKMSLNN